MPLHAAPQIGTKYVLTKGSVRVTLNDPTDPDNIGALTNIVGTDSPEVREDGENLVQSDGGAHGPFLYGRRPIVLEGLIYGHVSDAQRNERVARLLQVSDAMSEDVTLSWQPTGGAAVYSKLRRQQPPSISGGWNKTFQISLVAADPRFYSATLNTLTKTSTSASLVTNAGNAETFPVYTIWGPTSVATRIDVNGVGAVAFSKALDLDRGFVIDSLNRSITGYKRRVNWFWNPSFEHPSIGMVTNTTADVLGFYATGSPTLDPFAAMPAVSSGMGSHVLKMTTTGIGVFPKPGSIGSERMSTAVLMSGQGPPVTNTFRVPSFDLRADTYIVVSFSVLRAAASPSTYLPYISANYLDSSSEPVTSADWTTQYRGSTPISDTTWQRVSTVFTIPNTPTGAPPYVEVQIGALNPAGNMASGQVWYFDGVVVEFIQGSTTSGFFYPDGTTYAWEGAADNSRTYSIAADPLFPATSNYELIDVPLTTWTGLDAGLNTISLPGAFTSGGSLKVDWRDAWL